MCTPQIILCHFFVFDLTNIPADPVDQHRKSFKPFFQHIAPKLVEISTRGL